MPEVLISIFSNGKLERKYNQPVDLQLNTKLTEIALTLSLGGKILSVFSIFKETECATAGKLSYMVGVESENMFIQFQCERELEQLSSAVRQLKRTSDGSVFHQRTEESSAVQYFQFYAYLAQQQNMMQDYVRTSTYQKAMVSNVSDFRDKVVLDVGAGSGILSFFAVQAGARKVYAVEASSMVQHCSKLIKNNQLGGRIESISGKIEEIKLPEQVDMIISEPMGYMLYNERMLETYLHAKKWLKPGGRMFPTTGTLYVAPFTDDQLHMEQFQKSNFWHQNSFHGVDLSCLREEAVNEYFRQPVVDTFHVEICMSSAVSHTVDFEKIDESDLHLLDIPLSFDIVKTGLVHGLAFWFDVSFNGSTEKVVLSTGPTDPLTHWYQVRCLVATPVFVRAGCTMCGRCVLRANTRQSYDVEITLQEPGTEKVSTNTLDLKNPFFRYTGIAPAAPPGSNVGAESPSDRYWHGTQVMSDTLNDIAVMHQQQQQQRHDLAHHVETCVTQQLGTVSLDYQAPQASAVQQLVTAQPHASGSLGGMAGLPTAFTAHQPQAGGQSGVKVPQMGHPVGSQSAPIHPGSIPAVGSVSARSQAMFLTNQVQGAVSHSVANYNTHAPFSS